MLNAAILQGQAEGTGSGDATRARSRIGLHALAITCALVGGVAAIAGAFLQEIFSGTAGIFLVVAAAPIIEEALKPAGTYLLFLRWPDALRGRLHIAIMAALGGLTFALLESLLYETVYVPDGDASFRLYRFTAPVIMHVCASFIVGLGLRGSLFEWAAGRAPMPKSTRNFYLSGVVLHAVFNLTAVILVAVGILQFGQ